MALRLTMFVAAILIASHSLADAKPRHQIHHSRTYQTAGNVVEHPAGCPWRLFCGCGASVEIFGHPVRNLFLARAWFRFPRAYPAPGMAAVRNHHVMVLQAHISGDVWRVYDANSGGHATRVHERSIAGFVIVNPRAGLASL